MNIYVFEHEPWMEEYISQKLPGHNLTFIKDPLTSENAEKYKEADIISVFVFSKVDKKVLESLPNLKLITARSTGYDHIDIEAAKEEGIPVTNVPQYGSITVAEHTWALILSLSRRIFESYDRTERADFSVAGLRGFDLSGKTLGLIGLGEIGKHVAEMSKGFNMKLRVLNRTKDMDFARHFEHFVYVDSVEDIYTHSDVISFHVPLVESTFHMLNTENYHLLKKGSVVVNTSRGAIIQTEALVKALEEDIIRGAGLDVLESENLMKKNQAGSLPKENELAEAYLNHVLIGMDNVVLTPHNAFNSDESIRRLLDGNIKNISAFINKQSETLDKVN